MFTNFTDPSSLPADEVSLLAQNQFLVAVAIVVFILFVRVAERYARARQKRQAHYGRLFNSTMHKTEVKEKKRVATEAR